MVAPSLADRLRAAMNEARKQRDQARTLLLSTILSDIKNREIELNHTPTDDETAEVLRRGVKRRRESVEAYEKAGRTELADREKAEIKALEEFLPASVAPEEIRAAVREAIAGGATDMGKVMGAVMPKLKGRADGKLVNQIVREEMAGSTKTESRSNVPKPSGGWRSTPRGRWVPPVSPPAIPPLTPPPFAARSRRSPSWRRC